MSVLPLYSSGYCASPTIPITVELSSLQLIATKRNTFDVCLTTDNSLQLLLTINYDRLMPSRAVLQTRTCLGDAFGVAVPRLWNTLPITLRQPDLSLSLGQFRRALKMHLFDCVCRA